jgi:hypothetical protein
MQIILMVSIVAAVGGAIVAALTYVVDKNAGKQDRE